MRLFLSQTRTRIVYWRSVFGRRVRMQSVTSGSSTTVFALRCSPCSKPNQSCARLRSIPQPATRSQPARLHKSNFKNDHEGEPTGSPYSYEASCRPLLLAFSNSLEYGGQRVAVFHFSHNVDARRLRGFVKLLNREEQRLTFKIPQLSEYPVNEVAVGFRFGLGGASRRGDPQGYFTSVTTCCDFS